MATTQVTPAVNGNGSSNNSSSTSNAAKPDNKLREVKVTLAESQEAVIVHENTMQIIGKLFTAQDDIENESKYTRAFLHSAVLQAGKQECRRIQNLWETAVTNVTKLHPTMNREQAAAELLASRKMRELKARVDVATSLLKTEFK